MIDLQAAPLSGRSLSASLTVRDLSASVAWYCDVVGFTIDRKHERDGKLMSVAVKAGEVRILLNQDDGAKGLDRVKGEGFSLMLMLDGGIDDLAAGIKSRGGSLVIEPTDTPWGSRAFRVEDPDGFRFTIAAPLG